VPITLALLLMLPGCGTVGSNAGANAAASTLTGANSTSGAATSANLAADTTSVASFTIAGGSSGTYNITTTLPTSKLRHGHKEFTIFLANAGKSLIIVFYGYSGPGTYTLTNEQNGGEVRIAFDQQAASWDLALRPHNSCTLVIASDVPTGQAGLDRMKGSFTCPVLVSSNPQRPEKPIMVDRGQFDIAMIVES
jgi:hypothetical protein